MQKYKNCCFRFIFIIDFVSICVYNKQDSGIIMGYYRKTNNEAEYFMTIHEIKGWLMSIELFQLYQSVFDAALDIDCRNR